VFSDFLHEVEIHDRTVITVEPSDFNALKLLLGWQTGRLGILVTCKNLFPLILQCFEAAGWVRGLAASCLYENSLQHPLLSRRQPANSGFPGK